MLLPAFGSINALDSAGEGGRHGDVCGTSASLAWSRTCLTPGRARDHPDAGRLADLPTIRISLTVRHRRPRKPVPGRAVAGRTVPHAAGSNPPVGSPVDSQPQSAPLIRGRRAHLGRQSPPARTGIMQLCPRRQGVFGRGLGRRRALTRSEADAGCTAWVGPIVLCGRDRPQRKGAAPKSGPVVN